MMDAVIYGITPNANIEKVLKLPPLIRFNKSKKPKFCVIVFAPGTIILVPSPNIASTNKVK